MADWRVIERTGQTLVRLLERRLVQAGMSGVDVRLLTPAGFQELATVTTPTISLFLYRVTENAERRNAPQRRAPDGTLRRQPLALELCYLVTPWGARGATPSVEGDAIATAEEARLIGLILQAFYDRAELATADLVEDPVTPVWEPGDGLQVMLDSLPIQDHYRIWDSSELGYHLSLSYKVRVAHLDTIELRLAPPVVEATFGAAP